MKHLALLFVPMVFAGTLFMMTCSEYTPQVVSASLDSSDANMVKRGAYLVTTLGCNDCHSPKHIGAQGLEVIPELSLSGYPSDRPMTTVFREALSKGWTLHNADQTLSIGPWGAAFAANISSDETGIGNWSLTQFKLAMTKGKSKGIDDARTLLPPMPWQNYAYMPDKDLEAIFAYLQSTQPVSNVVPEHISPEQLR